MRYKEVFPFEQKEKIPFENAMKGFNLYKKEIEESFNNQERFFPKLDVYKVNIPTYPPKYTIKDLNCKSIEDVKYVLSMGGNVVATVGGFDFSIESVRDNYLITSGQWLADKFLLNFENCNRVIGSYRI
jgi:hypothetical protein